MYESRHEYGKPTLKWSMNIIISTPEHGNCEYGTPFIDNDRDNSALSNPSEIAVKSDLEPKIQIAHQELRENAPQKFSPQQTDHVTERIRIPPWNMMRTWMRNNSALILQTPQYGIRPTSQFEA